MPPPDLSAAARSRLDIRAFLTEFRQRVGESLSADAELLSASRDAVDDGRALLKRVGRDHPAPER